MPIGFIETRAKAIDRDRVLITPLPTDNPNQEFARRQLEFTQACAKLQPVVGYDLKRRGTEGFVDVFVESMKPLEQKGKYNPKTVRERVEEAVSKLAHTSDRPGINYQMGDFVAMGQIGNPYVPPSTRLKTFAQYAQRVEAAGYQSRRSPGFFIEMHPFSPITKIPSKIVHNMPREGMDVFEASTLRSGVPQLEPVHSMVKELMRLPSSLGVVIATGAYEPVYWDILIEGRGQGIEGDLMEAQAKAIIVGSRNQLEEVGIEKPVYFGGLVPMEDSRDLPSVMDRYLEFAKDQRRRTIGNFLYFEP